MFHGNSAPCAEQNLIPNNQHFIKEDSFESFCPMITNNQYSQCKIDGAPLPSLMRSHTEEAKLAMNSGKNHLRTKTFSSIYLLKGSRDLSIKENLGFSRRVSNRSDLSSTKRPDSVHGFHSLFSRSSRKDKKNHIVSHISRASTSTIIAGDISHMTTSKDNENTNQQNLISIPYNFRHIRHTRNDNPTFEIYRGPTEQVSESSSHLYARNQGDAERQTLQVDDLHFENFSSEALGVPNTQNTLVHDEHRSISALEKFHTRHRIVLRKKSTPDKESTSQTALSNITEISPHQLQLMPSSISSPTESIPTRKSSRTPSNVESIASSTSENFCHKSEWNSPLSLVTKTQSTPSTRSNHQDNFYSSFRNVQEKFDDESWPLPSSTNSSCFGIELADVEEEEEELLTSEYQILSVIKNQKNQGTFDFDEKLLGSADGFENESENSTQAEWDPLQPKRDPHMAQLPLNSSNLETGSWESDIDWCYEHEVEADFEYRWIEDETKEPRAETTKIFNSIKVPQLNVPDDVSIGKRNFCPSLLLPMREGYPELSPTSAAFTASPTPKTPVSFSQDLYITENSKDTSFINSIYTDNHLTDLTPIEFQTQMEHDVTYKDYCLREYHTTISPPRSYNSSISSFAESISSGSHGRSWSISKSSQRSASSTFTSDSTSSQEAKFHKHSASFSHQISKSRYLPSECVKTSHVQSKDAPFTKMAGFHFDRNTAKIPLLDRRNKTLRFDARLSPTSLPSLTVSPDDSGLPDFLDAERFTNQRGRTRSRPQPDRKLSAPFLSESNFDINNEKKPRSLSQVSARSGVKCSYGFFPQV